MPYRVPAPAPPDVELAYRPGIPIPALSRRPVLGSLLFLGLVLAFSFLLNARKATIECTPRASPLAGP